jgi:hypothetical protein
VDFITACVGLGLLAGFLGFCWDAVRGLVRDRNPILLLLGGWVILPFVYLWQARGVSPGIVWWGPGLLGWLAGYIAIVRFSSWVEHRWAPKGKA